MLYNVQYIQLFTKHEHGPDLNTLAQVKTLDTKPEKDRQAMERFLLETLERVQRGDVTSIMCIAESRAGYEYTRIAVPYEKAIGLTMRSIHDLNKSWDESK